MKKLLPNFFRRIGKIAAAASLSLLAMQANAQVSSNYLFSQATGTYTPITGGTQHGVGDGLDDETYSVTLPFTFTFNGTAYTQVYVSANGYVSFGATDPGTTTRTAISSGNTGFELASPYSRDLGGATPTSEVRSEVLGTGTNQIFVAQWTEMANYFDVQSYNFQVRLNQSNNTVQFVYSTMTAASNTTGQVGLRGTTNADYNNRTTTTDWAASTVGTSNSSTMRVGPTVFPASGYTLTFTPASCLSPTSPMITPPTTTGATLSWTPPSSVPSGGYDYAVFLQGQGPTGTPIVSGNTSGSSFTFNTLNPGTNYTAYVRSNCGGSQSGWLSANFTTPPTCAIPTAPTSTPATTSASLAWVQTGSPSQWEIEYGTGSSYTLGTGTRIVVGSNPYNLSPLNPGTQYSYFVRAICSPGDSSAWSVRHTFTTQCVPISTLPWTENFDALSTLGTTSYPPCWFKENGGWSTTNATTYNTPRSGANYLRDPWSATDEYMWTPGFQLTAGTSYDFSFYVQGDGYTDWVLDVFHNTSQSSTATTPTQLGTSYTPAGTGSQAIQPYVKQTHTFVPTTTGTYYFAIRVNEPTGDPWYLAFDDFTVEATPTCAAPSTLNATTTTTTATVSWSAVTGAAGYQYVLDQTSAATPTGTATSTTSTTPPTITGLTANTQYYLHVRTDCGGSGFSSWSVLGVKTQIANDDAPGALTLALGAGCTTPTSNATATQSANEPFASCIGSLVGYHTMWYKFVAPASGTVRATTNAATTTLDTRIAVFSATDVNDYSTFTILACDDDNGVTPSSAASTVFLTGLTAGTTYYVQVDGYGSSTGDICTSVDEITSSMLSSTAANCGGSPGVGANAAYLGWSTLVDDNGALIALVRNTTVATGSHSYSASPTIVSTTRTANGQSYLNRNFLINNSSVSGPVDIRFFMLSSEVTTLGAPLSNLNVTRKTGTTCEADYTPVAGTFSVLTQTGNGSINGVSWIDVQTPSFSNFFIMAGVSPLAIRLGELSAANEGTRNRVQWNSLEETPGDSYVVERSADGKNFVALGTVEGKGEASAYNYWDNNPINGANYYRLKLVNIDAQTAYSNTVKVMVKNTGAIVVEAYPNPVSNVLTVKAYGELSDNATVQVTDVTGKVVRTATLNGNSAEVNMTGLAAGMYLVKFTDGNHTQTIRVTKQ